MQFPYIWQDYAPKWQELIVSFTIYDINYAIFKPIKSWVILWSDPKESWYFDNLIVGLVRPNFVLYLCFWPFPNEMSKNGSTLSHYCTPKWDQPLIYIRIGVGSGCKAISATFTGFEIIPTWVWTCSIMPPGHKGFSLSSHPSSSFLSCWREWGWRDWGPSGGLGLLFSAMLHENEPHTDHLALVVSQSYRWLWQLWLLRGTNWVGSVWVCL